MEKHSNSKNAERGSSTGAVSSFFRGGFFGGAGKRSKTARSPHTRREMLALRPIRNPNLEWDDEDGQIVLTVRRIDNWKTRLILIFTQVPKSRRVELDPLGTHVWKMLDGKTSFEQIAKSLAKEFKLMPREAEMALQQFFKELGRRGYVGFMKQGSE